MGITLNLLNKDDYLELLPKLFDILYNNMSIISPTKNTYAQDYEFWYNGKFVLSISKTREQIIDYGSRKIKIYPDKLNDIKNYLIKANLNLINITETEFALIIVSSKI